ncbi:Aste57867_20454 [Aphanomyces stellatus]|uniref:Aste57867_20454 protein n=1 Tax=Aphanomyces stellatus TaxID=120398 RepID=A0A485LJS1_9STRA|nr:hypothetical protein As57867_020388 [Aphanomyces stellatus]VFT97140.1 Aste57867_20454 [Aphanomyces stellatus]
MGAGGSVPSPSSSPMDIQAVIDFHTLRTYSAHDVAALVARELGIHETTIVENGVDGLLLCELVDGDVPELASTLGVTDLSQLARLFKAFKSTQAAASTVGTEDVPNEQAQSTALVLEHDGSFVTTRCHSTADAFERQPKRTASIPKLALDTMLQRSASMDTLPSSQQERHTNQGMAKDLAPQQPVPSSLPMLKDEPCAGRELVLSV